MNQTSTEVSTTLSQHAFLEAVLAISTYLLALLNTTIPCCLHQQFPLTWPIPTQIILRHWIAFTVKPRSTPETATLYTQAMMATRAADANLSLVQLLNLISNIMAAQLETSQPQSVPTRSQHAARTAELWQSTTQLLKICWFDCRCRTVWSNDSIYRLSIRQEILRSTGR